MKVYEINPTKDTPDKVRAVIVDAAAQTVVCDYDGSLMFPGGKVGPGESLEEAVHREVREELGTDVGGGAPLFTIGMTAENYPLVGGGVRAVHRVETAYVLFSVREFVFGERELTDRERGVLAYNVVALRGLRSLMEIHQTNNPRAPFFRAEMMAATRRLMKTHRFA